MSDDPAHLCYAGDYFSDTEVMFFDMEQYGTYRKVIDYLYLNKGYLVVNWVAIAMLFNVKRRDKAEKMFQKVAHKFQIINGQITHKRVLEELQKRAKYKLMQQNKGKKGADVRWNKDSRGHNTPKCPVPSPGHCPNDGTTFPLSSSSISNTNIYNPHCGGKPTNEQVKEYADSIGYPDLDAEGFVAYYESRGWLVSQGQQVMDWRPLVTTWKKNRSKFDANDRATSTNSGKRYQSQGKPEDGSETDWEELKRRSEKKTV